MQPEGGGGESEAEADDDRRAKGKDEPPQEPGERGAGQHDLGGAEAEDLTSQGPQPGQLQFKADDEEQEDDAEFADMENFLAFRDQPEKRTHRDTGEKIAEHGAEADALEQRPGHDPTPQEQQHFEELCVGAMFQVSVPLPDSVLRHLIALQRRLDASRLQQ